MRLHIMLDDEIVSEIDRRAGRGRRSAFIAETVVQALDDARRWEQIESALGSISDGDHIWDADAAGWVAGQRSGDPTRVG